MSTVRKETVRRSKKVPWNHMTPPRTVFESIGYADSCFGWIMQSISNDSKDPLDSSNRTGRMKPPSPLMRTVKYRTNGFPCIMITVESKDTVPCDNCIPLDGNPFRDFYPHDGFTVKCSFCDAEISSRTLQHMYHEDSWPSPWFPSCEKCSPNKNDSSTIKGIG